ncbi:MAG: HAMP domain-containing histidine kinase [Candidatus Cloacimonetes bacterium]|nr:HAMP domain-containing histidine kinase [Candidatus Cloacimonadota bacterium]
MKFRFGLRTIVVLLYLALFTAGLVLIYEYQESKRNELYEEITSLNLNEFMGKIAAEHPEHAEDARSLLCHLNEIKATIEMGNRHTAVYSAFYLILVLVLSLTLFLWAIYTLTNPLAKFSKAATEIARGNFDIQLKESGTWELKDAQKSFNLMSTQLQKTQEKLLEAEKLSIWKQFSRMLAHEIKNPLTPIRLSLERLIEKKHSEKFEEVFDRCTSIISQEVENLQALASNFSNFAKDVPINQKRFHILEQIRGITRSYDDRVEIIITGEDFAIEFDMMHFYQILTNVFQNAIDAAGQGEKLELRLDSTQRSLEIRDHGPGIEPEDINKIFEPYFTKKKKGIGLGLALVKKLTNINHAEINVTSQPGEGSSFIIKFSEVKAIIGGNNENNDH